MAGGRGPREGGGLAGAGETGGSSRVACQTGLGSKSDRGELSGILRDRKADLQIVKWKDDAHLSTFEKTLYDFGFKPSGPGF